jgi:hypothetical protein
MVLKLILFTILQCVPLYVWTLLLKRRQIQVDWRLALSYFIFGSWFGMFGELFLFKFIDWIFHFQIWEYRTLPIHDGKTSSYGAIMWGNAAVYICFHKNYQLNQHKKRNLLTSFLLESSYLLILEILFNFLAYGLFNEYFFYYFVPDLMHWSSFTNMPFWWAGYQIMVKYAKVMYKQEKLNLAIAVMMIIIAFAYQ